VLEEFERSEHLFSSLPTCWILSFTRKWWVLSPRS